MDDILKPPTWRRDDGLFRIDLKLLIYPGALSPHDVTRRLDLMPSGWGWAQDPAEARRLGKRPLPNSWFLESEQLVDAPNLLAHIEWMLAQLEPRQTALAALLREPDARASLRLVLWSEQGGCAVTIPPQHLARLAALSLPLELSFANYPADETDGA